MASSAKGSSSTSIDASKNEPGSSNPKPNLSVDSYTPSLSFTAGATPHAVPASRGVRYLFQPDPTTRRPPPTQPMLASFDDAPPGRNAGGSVKAQPVILQGSAIEPVPFQGSSIPTPRFQNPPKARPRPECHSSINTLVPFQPRNLSEICGDIYNACAAVGILRAGVNRFMNVLMTSTFPPFASVMEFQPSYPKPFLETNILEQLEKEQEGRRRKAGRKRKRAEAASTERKRKRAEMVQLPQMRTILNLMNGCFGALVLSRHRGFEKAIKSLQIQLDASKVGIEDAVAASRVALFGKSPVSTEEGNRICQTIHANIIGALLSGFGSTLFANETRSGIPDYVALEFTSPAQLADYRSEIYCRVLSVWVNALEIATNARALAIAGVDGWYELGPDKIRASVDLFVAIVRQHENQPTAATLATKGARHLAVCSDVAWTVLRGALPRELLEAVRRFGAERHSMLEEEATKLLEKLHPDEAA